jgi:cation diffusion facilitator family transporter
MLHKDAQKEKSQAALNSVIAAVGLTAFKIVVGLITNSLGILAEAAHSALDLAAALMTLFAVRVADQPADREHPFGHGKTENLSALFETLLLLATSAWIVYEAIHRLMTPGVHVDVSIWAFIVMGTSIVVDFSRSRMLLAAAKKHNSQALEADALHFSTDVWSSSVVIVGLIGVWIASFVPALAFLEKADAIAALGVALIVIYVSGELGYRTIQALLDSAPGGMPAQIKQAAESVPGVIDCHAVRIRPSGAHWFVDLHVTMDGGRTLEDTHTSTEEIERRVQKILSRADVTVHAEPIDLPASP